MSERAVKDVFFFFLFLIFTAANYEENLGKSEHLYLNTEWQIQTLNSKANNQ